MSWHIVRGSLIASVVFRFYTEDNGIYLLFWLESDHVCLSFNLFLCELAHRWFFDSFSCVIEDLLDFIQSIMELICCFGLRVVTFA